MIPSHQCGRVVEAAWLCILPPKHEGPCQRAPGRPNPGPTAEQLAWRLLRAARVTW